MAFGHCRKRDTAGLVWLELYVQHADLCATRETQAWEKIEMVLVGKKELVWERRIKNGKSGMLGCMQTENF